MPRRRQVVVDLVQHGADFGGDFGRDFGRRWNVVELRFKF